MIKVLLFTASLGDGHRQASAALRQVLEARGATALEIDSFQGTSPLMARFSQFNYEWSTRYTPFLYGASYWWTAGLGPRNPLWKAMALMSRRAALAALREHRPDAVIQLFPDHSLARLPVGWHKPFIAMVLTDYSLHGHWFHEGVNTYFAPHPWMLEPARRFLLDGQEMVATGIPVRPLFLRCDLRWNAEHNGAVGGGETAVDQPYVLFMAGGRGVFPQLESALRVVRAALPAHAVYVMCGRNEGMLRRVRELAAELPRVYGLPFQHNVASWLQRASAAVIKSGGITVSECLASLCPMVLFRPLAGQEADNAHFIERLGAGKVARTLEELSSALKALQEPDTVARMVRACQEAARLDAADRIVEHVFRRVRERREVGLDASGRLAAGRLPVGSA
ncbi:MAG: galactosyldiacylglycerol synthase [Alicyclobacillaceae bacterium]|nr:galactosyldiacylglycerol synthase [Alicyclobacillaceae bacterium]